MILYSDLLESVGKWIQSISYIENKRNDDKSNVSLFLRYVVTAWYVLTLDGPELSLSSDEYARLCEILRKGYVIFESIYAQNCVCQWMFGYMMEVRADLFYESGKSDFDAIEKTGKRLIMDACESGDKIAKLLYHIDHASLIEIS